MAETTYETLRVVWLTGAPANLAAPTIAEINAGTDLTDEIPVDGVNKGGGANNASQAKLGTAFVAEEPGTWGRTLEITFMRDTAADAWGLFGYRTEGYLVFVAEGSGTGGAPAATDDCEVWHVKSHERMDLQSAENEYQKFSVQFAVLAAPEYDAVIAA